MLVGGKIRTAAILAAVGCLLASVLPVQAQSVDDGLWRAIASCQKVVTRHITLAESAISSATVQFNDTSSNVQGYLQRWGERVAISVPEQPNIRDSVKKCLQAYAADRAAAGADFSNKMRKSLSDTVLWYDAKIFSLFTDVVSEAARDGVVQTIQEYMAPSLKQLDNVIVTGLKDSAKSLKSSFQKASACIRTLSIQVDNPDL